MPEHCCVKSTCIIRTMLSPATSVVVVPVHSGMPVDDPDEGSDRTLMIDSAVGVSSGNLTATASTVSSGVTVPGYEHWHGMTCSISIVPFGRAGAPPGKSPMIAVSMSPAAVSVVAVGHVPSASSGEIVLGGLSRVMAVR